MEVNRLLRDELAYELTIRGLPVQNTVDENRSTLRGVLKLERDGLSLADCAHKLDPNEEITICREKLQILDNDIKAFDKANKVNEYKRISSRLCHLQFRLKRIQIDSPEVQMERNHLLTKSLQLIDTLEQLVGRRNNADDSLIILDQDNNVEGSLIDEPNVLLPEVTVTSPARPNNEENAAGMGNSTIIRDGKDLMEEMEAVRYLVRQNNEGLSNILERNPIGRSSAFDAIQRERNARVNREAPQGDIQNRCQIEDDRIHLNLHSNPCHYRFAENPVKENLLQRTHRAMTSSNWNDVRGDRNVRFNTDALQGDVPNRYQMEDRRSHENRYANLYQNSYAVNPEDGNYFSRSHREDVANPNYNNFQDLEQRLRSMEMKPSGFNADISRWRLQFDGNASVTDFLERLEELRLSRGVSKEQLLRSASELFCKDALMWFRTRQFHSWDHLVEELKTDFQPYDYEYELLEEIRGRTQGAKEKIITFVSAMENLFNKLGPAKPEESVRVKMIRRNLLPYLQNHLALHNIGSISDLLKQCKAVEETAVRTQKFVPPPTNYKQLLEPTLAYHKPIGSAIDYTVSALNTPANTELATIQMETTSKNEDSKAICWNCNEPGHRFRKCTKPRKKFCFRCGKNNVLANTCSNCAQKNEVKRTM